MEFKIFGREIYVNKGIIAVSILILLAVLGVIGYLVKVGNEPIIFLPKEGSAVSTTNEAVRTPGENKFPSPTPAEIQEQIKVYITGCVKKPGIVTLTKGQMIFDAVNAAGGLTDEADKNINMVYVLNDNVWIDIKSKKEAERAVEVKSSDNGKSSKNSSDIGNKSEATVNNAGQGIKIVKDSGGLVSNEKNEAAGGKININTATAEEMDAVLPGIGPAIAADIVEYRNKHGKFKSIEDLLNVPGIGESKLNRMKELITVS
ncbi:MAG TPA: helix-hairpin-helix domain-containing protein [Pseudobacteroides sp.]|uniref:helix-hairpin-helix domain-containing protein n=1 Tax=Pseudobacteroides sp. TaxID=1968840 RepID=UPI002F95B44D